MASMDLRAEACMQFEKFRKFLETEVGVEPEETIHLYGQIKYGTYQPVPTSGETRAQQFTPYKPDQLC